MVPLPEVVNISGHSGQSHEHLDFSVDCRSEGWVQALRQTFLDQFLDYAVVGDEDDECVEQNVGDHPVTLPAISTVDNVTAVCFVGPLVACSSDSETVWQYGEE